jgi:hypothetical protein
MTCEEMAALLVDDRTHQAPDVDAHLASCAECREVLAADARARELGRWDTVPQLPAPDGWSRLGWPRRARFGLAAAGVLAMAALAAIAVTAEVGRAIPRSDSERALPPPLRAATETEPLRASGEGPSAKAAPSGDESLVDDLVVESSAYVRREVSVRDALYGPFGDLPRWVSLPRNRSLDAPVFQKALYPIHTDLF